MNTFLRSALIAAALALVIEGTVGGQTVTVPGPAGGVPVILLNGYQVTCTNTDSTLAASQDTFGQLAALLQSDGLSVVFFNNCAYGIDAPIEQLAAQLSLYITGLRYSDGTPVTQVDLVAHSMGGLIARAYLAGKGQASGLFVPPADHRVRKLVTLATPHFGSYQAANIGNQQAEQTLGSQFLWDLATWNQGQDDLRGVDALALAGNAGSTESASNASDGVVSLTSASLGFTRADQRTRVVPYCHITASGFLAFLLDCDGQGIADIDSPSHLTAQIVRSFLAGTSAWQSIGHPPSQDLLLAVDGGVELASKTANDVYFTDLTSVQSDGGVGLLAAGPDHSIASIYYNEFIPAGQRTFTMTHSSGPPATGTAAVPAGGSKAVLFKSGPRIAGVQNMPPSGLPGLTIASGSTIVVSGIGFSSAGTTQLLADGTALPTSQISDQQITAALPASYGGLVRLTVVNGNGRHTVNIMTAAPGGAGIQVSSVTNAASSAPGAIAPGEIVAIKGNALGPAAGVSFSVNPSTGMVDSALAGARVFFDEFPAPILYASANQVNAIVPYEIAGRPQVGMQVQYQGASASTALAVATAAPAAFTADSTGSGQALAVNQDGSVNGSSHPAAKGSVVSIYFTGGGLTNPPGVTGSVTGSVLKELTQKASVTVGGKPAAEVSFAGAAPTFVDGVGQLNLRLADDTPSGSAQAVVITVGGLSSPATATIAVF